LKLVNTIIANTKGDGEKSGEDFWVKAEKLYYTALCRRQVQRLRASVNHRMVQSVRPAAKIFTDFTSIDFGIAK